MTAEPARTSDTLLSSLDAVLRGHHLAPERIRAGHVDAPARRLTGLGLLLGAIYGAAAGSYAVFRGGEHAWWQVLSSACKVPLLFLLTLVVTFPSLYVFAALQRLPLNFASTLRLLLLAIIVHLAVLASLAPVFAFFAASTNSYHFMLLLNVAFFAVGGVLGLMVLRRATRTMFAHPPGGDGAPPLPRDAAAQARTVLRIWCVVYGVVGAQMGWLLRPFLGSPELPFAVFRPREDNVFVGVLRALRALFAG
jgi:hypothetical protein